jgi:hypothetical protein
LGNFQQFGFGLERLGRRWDLRINGHFPISGFPFEGTKHEKKCCFNQFSGECPFIGDFCAVFKQQEFDFTGFDAEVGVYLVKSKSRDFFLYLAAGPYYLSGRFDHNIWGVKARLRPQYSDYFALELSTSYDRVFRNIYQAEIIITLPLYRWFSKRERTCLSHRQIYQPVQRFEIIPLRHHSRWKTNF